MPNEDWMDPFTQRSDLTLVDITFPASHDAGLSRANYQGYGRTSSAKDTICHEDDIAGQLAAGARAFDLRMDVSGGVLKTFHGEGFFGSIGGGWGQRADTIFQQVDTFLGAHGGEIVILRISHTAESAGAHTAILGTLDPARLYKCGPRNLATEPLSKLRGKAIAIFDKKALASADPMRGLHRLVKYKADGAPEAGLPICGEYAGQSAGMTAMVKLALTCGNEHGTHKRLLRGKHDHLFMVYWQLAMNVETKTTKGQDQRVKKLKKIDGNKGTHYNLDYLFHAHRGFFYAMQEVGSVASNVTKANRGYHRPNYVNLDFVNDVACGKVIEFNNELLPNAPALQQVG